MKKFLTLYADPPWNETGGGRIKRGADRHYPLMKTRDIADLPVKEVMADNSHLYLWVTNNFMEDGYAVCRAWGYRPVTLITWAKDGRIGLGQYYRGQTEHCIFAVRGCLPYKSIGGKRAQGTTLLTAPRTAHSEKPEEMRRRIERVSYGPMLELFARPRAKLMSDWTYFGHGVDGKDIAEGLRSLSL